jgi:hypothetical protein
VIEFRYHIVSLIAVFLALAVGIVLGAGPLKEAIGTQLTGQVAQLRDEKAALRTELDAANHGLDNRDKFIDAAAPSLLGGLLDGRRVAIVTLDQPSPTVVGSIRDRLVQAGATVTGEVDVEKLWTDPTQRAFRESLSGSLLAPTTPREWTGCSVRRSRRASPDVRPAPRTPSPIRRGSSSTCFVRAS